MQQSGLVAPEIQEIGGYQIVDLVGRGAHTAVYRAYQPALGRWVAVKLLPRPPEPDAFVAHFRRVAETSARLEHPNILAVHDYGQQGGIPYLVMPYVAGGTFEQWLQARAPRAHALRIILQVCGALAYAHRQRVVHGNVTPRNVLLHDENRALLADFGMAGLLDGLGVAPAGSVCGTAEYMAPEQAHGAPLDPRADVYAVGVMLYRVLSGGLPFSGGSPAQVLARHVEAPIPLLRLPDVAVARVWDAVLARALAKAPARRFASAEELAAAIQTAMEQERALAQAADGGERLAERSRHEAAGLAASGAASAGRVDPGVDRSGRPAAVRPASDVVGYGDAALARSAGERRGGPRAGRADRGSRPRRWMVPRGRLPLLALGAALALVVLGGALVGPRGTATGQRPAPAALATVPAGSAGPSPSTAAAAGEMAANVVLQDDFGNPSSGWPRQSNDPSTRRVGYVEGEYSIVKVANSVGAPFVSPSEVNVADFLWELDARLLAPTTDVYVYLDFRRQENGDHYSYVVDPNDSTFRLERTTGDSRRELLPWTKHAAIREGTARNRLGVRAAGAEIVLLANGEEVGRLRDDALAAGAIGFGIGNFRNGSADGRFDNLVVTVLPERP